MTTVILGTWYRRSQPAHGPDVIVVNFRDATLTRGGAVVRMSPTEFKIAAILLAARHRMLPRLEVFDLIWGDREDGGPLDKIIDRYICVIRRTLRKVGVEVETVWGQGFRTEIIPAGEISIPEPAPPIAPAISTLSMTARCASAAPTTLRFGGLVATRRAA